MNLLIIIILFYVSDWKFGKINCFWNKTLTVIKPLPLMMTNIPTGRGSERQKSEHWRVRISKVFLGWSEHQKIRTLKIRTSKIRTSSKVLVHFLAKNIFDVLILPMASEKISTSKIKKINYLWCITYVYQGLWGVRLGSIRLS